MKALKKWLPVVAAACAVLAMAMYMLLDAIKVDVAGGKKGVTALFGRDGGKFVFMMLLAVLFAVAGAVLSALNFLKPGKDLFMYIATGCFVVAAILVFLTKNFYLSANDLTALKSYVDLGIGAILGGVLCILAAVAAILPKFLKD